MRAMQLQDVLVLLCSLPNQQQIYICLKQTHLRIEALGHDVVVVRRLLGHGGQWGTRGAFLGLVNEEPICGNDVENSNCGKFGGANNAREREKWSKFPAHHVLNRGKIQTK